MSSERRRGGSARHQVLTGGVARLRIVDDADGRIGRTGNGACGCRQRFELHNGHFTIATDRPHVKVAWRISRRTEESK
jgi:hypothetical protein